MPFPEAIKIKAWRLSHHSCCLCKAIGVEIHHIVPEEAGGPDTFDNAAPLCPSCHEAYGANPTKQKMISEARDLWYEICATRYSSDADRINDLARDIASLKTQFLLPNVAEVLASAVIDRLATEGVLRQSNNASGWPLSRVLERLSRCEREMLGAKRRSIDVTYALLFETTGEATEPDVEFNEMRDEFRKTFGEFIARQFCAYLVGQYDIDWERGLTDDEGIKLLHLAFVEMVMLLFHEEFAKTDVRLCVKFTEQGQLWAGTTPHKTAVASGESSVKAKG